MIVAKIPNDSRQGVYLPGMQTHVNVVRDCVNNYIVTVQEAQELQAIYGDPYEEIEWCAPEPPEEGE